MQQIFPQLAGIYTALGPWVEALLRVLVGVCLIPHGLRICGFFPNTGMPPMSLKKLGNVLAKSGYRPGQFWVRVVVATEII